jgi:hypothetical protein
MSVGAFRLLSQRGARSERKTTKILEGGVFERCMLSPTDANSAACLEVVKATLVPLLENSGLPPSELHPMLGKYPGETRARRIDNKGHGQLLAIPDTPKVTALVFWSSNCRSCKDECLSCVEKNSICKKKRQLCRECQAEESFTPCLEILDGLEQIRRKTDTARFEVIAVAYGIEAVVARTKLANTSIGFPVVLDSKSGSLTRRYLVRGESPAVYIIDEKGKVRFYSDGSADVLSQIEAAVRSLLD